MNQLEQIKTQDLIPYARNSRTHSDEQVAQIMASINEFSFTNPILVDENKSIIAGHGRLLAAQRLNMDEVPCIVLDHLSEAQKKALVIADNKLALNAGWDNDMLSIELKELGELDFDLSLTGFGDDELAAFMADDDADEGEGGKGSLSARFGVPPFSVLNAREGWWQDRKRGWLAKGIKSEDGRSAPAGGSPDMMARERGEDGTSIFDPVLCELSYRWFAPQGGLVLDPFAGGSVRGVAASELGRQYIGYELRPEQVEANRGQADEICRDPMPAWVNDDSQNISVDIKADMIFSCPPYADLEVYSDDPKDLSTMPYEQFVETYSKIIKRSCEQLKEDRFAVFVVGEVRTKAGEYRNFVGDTIKAFLDAGMKYYNEMILVTPCGSVAMRAGNSFEGSRKVGKSHQNVLVFVKGDAKEATRAIGPVEFGEIEDEDTIN